MSALTPLIAAVIPFILWPLELFIPLPSLVEELAKAAAIFWIKKKSTRFNPNHTGVTVGLFFAISEGTLYLFNIISVGSLSTFLTRLALTIPLHIITSLLIANTLFCGKKRALLGVVGAVVIHFVYNAMVRNYSELLSLLSSIVT